MFPNMASGSLNAGTWSGPTLSPCPSCHNMSLMTGQDGGSGMGRQRGDSRAGSAFAIGGAPSLRDKVRLTDARQRCIGRRDERNRNCQVLPRTRRSGWRRPFARTFTSASPSRGHVTAPVPPAIANDRSSPHLRGDKMDSLRIEGGVPLKGEIVVSGAKTRRCP